MKRALLLVFVSLIWVSTAQARENQGYWFSKEDWPTETFNQWEEPDDGYKAEVNCDVAVNAPCGDWCDCGCREGKPCTCDHSEKDFAPLSYPEENYTDVDGYEDYYTCCGCCCKFPDWQRTKWCCAANRVYLGPYTILPGDAAYTFGHCGRWCVWLPQEGPLYRPMIASPRQLTYSVGWRFNDNALTKNVIPISYANNCAFVRWCNVWPWSGWLQINIEGGLWAVFDPCTESAPLLNADYYVGLPIEYALERWVFRLRAYHISSHVGDEFLLNHPNFDRRNPSAEYLDFYVSHMLTDEIRLYGGLGWVIQHDESFNTGKFYAEAGYEIRLPKYGFWDPCQHLYGLPFFAADYQYWNVFKKHIDSTYVLGWEWGKTSGEMKRLRAYILYHDGYNVDGQFCAKASNFFSVNLSYGY
jgi:hypothetical protein